VLCHQAASTFEFLHKCCHKFPSEAYKGGGVFVLKSSSLLCSGFLHLFPMFVFGIVNSVSKSKEICQVVCLRAISQSEHNLV
jgi:hypothetical protein